MYKLSIIVPIYNVEQYIDQTIESIIKQNRTEIEIILINDGSTDKSLDVCKKYEIYENIIIINKENGGLSDARNCGIKNSKGEYLLFLDGDDFLNENSLENIIYTIMNNPSIDIIIGNGMDLYFEEQGIIELRCNFKSDMIKDKPGYEVLEYFFNQSNFNNWSACSNIYRREFLISNKLFFKKGIFYEDAEWLPRVILSSKKSILIKENFYIYRRNRKDSIMSSISLKKIEDFINITDDIFNYISRKDYSKSLQYSVKKKYANALISILPKIYYLNKNDRKRIVERVNKMSDIFNYIKYDKKFYFNINKLLGWNVVAYLFYIIDKYKNILKKIIYFFR